MPSSRAGAAGRCLQQLGSRQSSRARETRSSSWARGHGLIFASERAGFGVMLQGDPVAAAAGATTNPVRRIGFASCKVS